MYIPVNPSFTIYKRGLRGSKLCRRVFVMNGLNDHKGLESIYKLRYSIVRGGVLGPPTRYLTQVVEKITRF